MRRATWSAARIAALLAATVVAGCPAAAAALDLLLTLQPSYSFQDSKTTSYNLVSNAELQALIQKYQLFLTQEMMPALRLEVGGYLTWNMGWAETDNVWSSLDQKLWEVNARLNFGNQPLQGQFYLALQQKLGWASIGGVTFHQPTVDQNVYGLTLTWSPSELPFVSLTLQHSDLYDTTRTFSNISTNSLYLTGKYSPVRPLTLVYTGRFENSDDKRHGVTSDSISNTGNVYYGDQFFNQRLLVSASYTLTGSNITYRVQSGAAPIPVQRFPTAGLSLVEAPPATPTLVTLANNPALIDGNVLASAGIDIGYAPSLAGDTNFRNVGAALADAITPVNLVYLYVDRPLPAEINSAFQWTAYRSNDNQNWTEVPVTGVTFGLIENRFEISIAPTQAQYVKVVTRPLAVGVSLDRTYADIFVTEIRLFNVVTVGSANGSLDSLVGTASGTLHLLLVRSLNFAYDFSAVFYHSSATNTVNRYTWNLMNALSLGGQVSRIFILTARLEDFIGSTAIASGEAAVSDLRFTAVAGATFLPTLRASLTYQGQISFVGSALSRNYQTGSLTASADLYRGVSLSAQLAYTYGTQGLAPGTAAGSTSQNQEFSSVTASAGLSIVPNPILTLGGAFSYSDAQSRIPGMPWVVQKTGVISGSLSFNPFPALSATVGVGWYPWYETPTLTENATVNFSPLPGGKLIFRFFYSQSLDTSTDSRTASWGPGLRWNIRPATYVDVYYTNSKVSNIAYSNLTNVVFVTLNITL